MSEIIPTPEGATELTQLRGLRHKVFALPNGKKRLVKKLGLVHYADKLDGRTLKDIVLDYRDEQGTGDTIADALPFRFRLHKTGIGFDYESRSGGIARVALVGINGQNNFNRNITYPKSRSGRVLTFADVRTDLDIQIRLNRDGLSIFRVLKSANAPRNFRWAVEYDEAGSGKIDKDIRGIDALRRRLQLAISNSTPELQPSGRYRYFAAESWNGMVRVVDPDTRVASWQDVAQYPVYIDPDITEEIATTSDDGWERPSGWVGSPYNTTISQGDFGGAYDAGFRFQSVAVPQGATIDLAVLKVNVTGKASAYSSGTVYGADADTTSTWGSANKVSDQTKTTASATFTAPTGTGIKSTTVTSIVQEIVDRPGWVSGNNMSLMITNGQSFKVNFFEDFSAAGTNEATLEIDYTEGGGGGAASRFLRRRTRRFQRAF